MTFKGGIEQVYGGKQVMSCDDDDMQFLGFNASFSLWCFFSSAKVWQQDICLLLSWVVPEGSQEFLFVIYLFGVTRHPHFSLVHSTVCVWSTHFCQSCFDLSTIPVQHCAPCSGEAFKWATDLRSPMLLIFQGTLISIQIWPPTPTKEFSVLYSLFLLCQLFPSMAHTKGHGFDLVNFLGLSLLELEVIHLDFKYISSFIASLCFHTNKLLVRFLYVSLSGWRVVKWAGVCFPLKM